MMEGTLQKRILRADCLWTHPALFRSPLKYLPLFADIFALMQSAYWPRERLERLQETRLAALFRDARRVPFWHGILSAADAGSAAAPREILERLPVVSKRELLSEGLERIADQSLIARSDIDHTSGSTGRPFHFYQDWGAELRSFAVTERTFRATGKRYPIVYMRARERYGFTPHRHHWFFCRNFNSVRHRTDELLLLASRIGPFILYGYTSWVVELARQMEMRGIELPIRAVVVAGEHLSPHDRAYLRRVMRARVFTLYASREVGFLGFECEHHRMHLNEEWALIEIVDPDGRRLPPGREGRIAVTPFDNRVMPFIRYEVGDVGAIHDEPCPCGRTLRTLDFRGRTTELIEFEDDRVVSLLDIAFALGSYRDTIRQYQIVQEGHMAFCFRVVSGPRFASEREHIEGMMLRLLHPRVRIRWDVVEELEASPSGKAAYFIRYDSPS